jgi:hypothetical protein
VNRAFYLVLWLFEALAIVGLALALSLPVQDYALREFIQWRQHPSPETYQAFVQKRRQENALRLIIALSFGVAAGVLAVPLRKYRRNPR